MLAINDHMKLAGMPGTIKNYFEEVAFKSANLKNKVGAAFGSYGWSGEASNIVLEILKNRFGMNITERPLFAKCTPDQKFLEKCFAPDKKTAESLIRRE